MKITAKLREHLVKNSGLSANASDDDARRVVAEKMAAGALTVEQFAEFTKADSSVDKFKSLVDSAVQAQVAPIAAALGELGTILKNLRGGDGAQTATGTPGAGGDSLASVLNQKAFGASGAAHVSGASVETGGAGAAPAGGNSSTAGPDAKAVSGRTVMIGGEGTSQTGGNAPRVKNPLEGYTHTKSAATYLHSSKDTLKKHFGAMPVMSAKDGEGARALDFASQADKAVAGAYFKFALAANGAMDGKGVPANFRMTDHDQQIVEYALHELPWTGMIGYHEKSDTAKATIGARKLHGWERKALLDDVLSGGLQAAPIAFDDAVIIQPLLNGELFPYINLVNVTRGRRIEAFSIGNPTFTWGIAEGTNIPIFNTDSFIAAFDNNIYNATGALPIGIDFEEDAPNNIGDIVTQRYGEAALTTLDMVVAVGDGVTQPQGVVNASGTQTIMAANGTGGPPSLTDYSSLLFGLPKQYRQKRAVFLTNDTTYQRSRGLTVDPAATSDVRRLLGMNFEAYNTIGHDHKINNSMGDSQAVFFDPGRYRMYRRLGLQIRIETAGQTLALLNERLIVCRMRFGGALELGAAAAVSTDFQS